jgi:hypothetical protein
MLDGKSLPTDCGQTGEQDIAILPQKAVLYPNVLPPNPPFDGYIGRFFFV